MVTSAISAVVVSHYLPQNIPAPPNKTHPKNGNSRESDRTAERPPQSSSLPSSSSTSLELPIAVPNVSDAKASEIFKQVKEYRRKIEVRIEGKWKSGAHIISGDDVLVTMVL